MPPASVSDRSSICCREGRSRTGGNVSVGSFLNLRRKVVAAPFDLLQLTTRDRRPYLVLDTARKALNAAQGFRYNRTTERWERSTSMRL